MADRGPNDARPSSVRSDQDRLNGRIYSAPNIARWYTRHDLDGAETMALLRYQPAFAGRDVLDMGVGAGRTSRYLAPLSRRYVCVDFSPPMVSYVRAHFPAVDVRLADMRDLSAFADASFDFVLASCNLIDAVSHVDRLRVLGEVRRVIRRPGVFAFSSHNRRFRTALSGPIWQWSRNPATQFLHALRYLRGMMNHARVGRLRRNEDGYALLNDAGHDYAALHYYIDRRTQRRQLCEAGFRVTDEFDITGRRLNDADDDADSPSVMYVAEATERAGQGG